MDKAALSLAASKCLARAQGQHGRIELPIHLPANDGPCNPGTLFELDWRVTEGGGLSVRAIIDSMVFGETTL